MEKIIHPRCVGKTTQLIKKSAQSGDYIVCASWQHSFRIEQQALRMGLKIPQPITFSEFLQKAYYAPGISGFLIDDVDICLQSLTKVPINAISLTK